MPESAKFWDRIARRYARSPIADEASYHHKLDITRRYLTPQSTLLEFGCGTGGTAIIHAPRVQSILATDISAAMLEIAAEKAAAAGVDNLTFQRGTLAELELAPASFDVVLGLSILHLLEDRQAALARVFELLKPGGVFISSTMCLGDGYRWFRYVGPLGRRLGLFPLVKMFTRVELEQELAAAGFVLDYQWQPSPKKAVFLVARKPA